MQLHSCEFITWPRERQGKRDRRSEREIARDSVNEMAGKKQLEL